MKNKELIAQSIDARVLRHKIGLDIKVFIGCAIPMILFMIVLFREFPKEMIKIIFGYLALTSFMCALRIVNPIVKLCFLLKKSDTYMFFNAKLSQYHTCGRRFFFTISVSDHNENRYEGETDAIYTAGSTVANFEEWHNKNVLVAYDPDCEKMIVVGLAENYTQNADNPSPRPTPHPR